MSCLISGLLVIDNEGHEHETRHIDGIDYHLFFAVEADKENHFIWETNGHRYVMSSMISIEKLFEVVISVK